MENLNRKVVQPSYQYPVKALQIGEGNFIRSFIDWMIHRCNEKGLFQGSISVAQPIPVGRIDQLNEQDGLYTVWVKGLDNGQTVDEGEVIASVSEAMDPYTEWERFMKMAENPDLEIVFSNTTEAGISYREEQYDPSQPMASFPGKMTMFLERRFKTLGANAGLVFIPCELIDRPGSALKALIIRHSKEWNLDPAFIQYVEDKVTFLNTLVDRIVTGYPANASEYYEKLGYTDNLLSVTEPYYQWVIEGDEALAAKLPVREAGLNVIWTNDLKPYSMRKVRLLNGAHTFMVPMSHLHGHDIVRDSVKDPWIKERLMKFLSEVVVPILPFPAEEGMKYIERTIERFSNPFLDHKLLDIALNSISKFQSRLLPTMVESLAKNGKLPELMLESLAYLLRFYRSTKTEQGWTGIRYVNGQKAEYPVRDTESIVERLSGLWAKYDNHGDVNVLVRDILSANDIWLTPFSAVSGLEGKFDEICDKTAGYLKAILKEEEAN